ncbi:MAG: hypothetical protein AAF349_16115, partial [Cyanobacteria bacterium P01_A01_bin.68]
MNEAKGTIEAFAGAKWYERTVGAYRGTHRDVFNDIDQRLRYCVQKLQLGVSVDMWPKQDEGDRQQDMGHVYHLLEQLLAN